MSSDSDSDINLLLKMNAIHEANEPKMELQQSYFSDQIEYCKHDSKKLWKIIKQFWPSKPKNNIIPKIDNFTDPLNKANSLNTYFAKIGSKLATKMPLDISDNEVNTDVPKTECSFSMNILTIEELQIILSDMKSSNSCGIDGISIKTIKQGV